MFTKEKSGNLPSSVPILSTASSGSGSIISGLPALTIKPGINGTINQSSTPLTSIHTITLPELIGVPSRDDEPRTKSERSTKVFVGKIPSGLSDYFMEQLFIECGAIQSWKRALDSSGKPLGFGFVEFQHVEGMLRCLRLMNGLKILNSRLTVRVDMQTEFFIKEWSDLKRADWERRRWDGLLPDHSKEKTWEESLTADDERVGYNLNLIIHNFETNKGEDFETVEQDK